MVEPVGPSITARRVAAYRLGFERLAAPGDGDPDADDRLAADVAAGVSVDRMSPMGRHLRARTRFFDRVTVTALEREVAQMVLVGAGYDGRALRYRTPGVRWWEIDRPVTQCDKQSRLARLAIASDAVTYLGLDLSTEGLARALLETGFEPDAPALYLAEGVGHYLAGDTVRHVLCELRSLATPGTRVAISFGRAGADPIERARFEAAVTTLGEPTMSSITDEDAGAVLAACQWRPVELAERSRAAGFVVAAPIFVPAGRDVPPTVGRIGRFGASLLTC